MALELAGQLRLSVPPEESFDWLVRALVGGVGTRVPGGQHLTGARTRANHLTYAIRLYDANGAFAQCCAFGTRSDVVGAGTYPIAGGVPSNAEELDQCDTACAGL